VILEVALNQERSTEVVTFLKKLGQTESYISTYAVDAIGYILFRRRQHEQFQQILSDILGKLNIQQVGLQHSEMDRLVWLSVTYTLDFDDAYQYALAEKYDLTIVSYDTDFNRTPRGRTTPGAILHQLRATDEPTPDETG
jgi:predicted nucleic acid-binding protein